MSGNTEFLALGTAVCIAFSGLVAMDASRRLGSVSFTQWRMIFAFVVMGLLGTAIGAWETLSSVPLGALLILSAVLGIVVGDTALFACLSRLGPRRTSLLFSLNAPFAAAMGVILLGETMSLFQAIGVALIMIGICLTVFFRDTNTENTKWEEVRGSLVIGVGFGVLAAFGQAAGTLIARPVMDAGVHPVTATAVRVGCAALILLIMGRLPISVFKGREPLSKQTFFLTLLSACIGMGLGMTLQMAALTEGRVAIVATFSSMTPIMVLPMLWFASRRIPSTLSWIGAVVAVMGTSMIFNF